MAQEAAERTALVRLPGSPESLSITYRLVRRNRRTIGLKISENGLIVSASSRVSISEVEEIIEKHILWILRKTQERKEREKKAQVDFREGGLLPYRGRKVKIALDPAASSPGLREEAPGSFALALPLPKDASESEIKAAAGAWLIDEAARVLPERLHWMELFAPEPSTGFVLTSARTFWGKCHRSGLIRLNWRLIFFENDVIDYVAAHELAHRVEMNHSPAFWATVEFIKPNYKKARAVLKQTGMTGLPF